jgi:hypothetical protein
MNIRSMISIWFFIGAILTVYGAIILVSNLVMAPPPGVMLAELHAGAWWGGVLFVVGLFYTIRFRPRD